MTGKFPLAFNLSFCPLEFAELRISPKLTESVLPKNLDNPRPSPYTIPAGYIIRAFIRLLVGRIRLAAQDTALSRRRSGVRIPYALPTFFPVLRLFPRPFAGRGFSIAPAARPL